MRLLRLGKHPYPTHRKSPALPRPGSEDASTIISGEASSAVWRAVRLHDGCTHGIGLTRYERYKWKKDTVTDSVLSGGAEGIRTPDLLNAIQTRSQLRHSPEQLS